MVNRGQLAGLERAAGTSDPHQIEQLQVIIAPGEAFRKAQTELDRDQVKDEHQQ